MFTQERLKIVPAKEFSPKDSRHCIKDISLILTFIWEQQVANTVMMIMIIITTQIH
jgi:hypothetical protein